MALLTQSLFKEPISSRSPLGLPVTVLSPNLEVFLPSPSGPAPKQLQRLFMILSNL
jgi:hypothetical protein